MERTPWIIAGSIVLAAVIIAIALFATKEGEAPTSEEPAVGQTEFLQAREEAQDRAAQSSLRNALAAAKTYFTDNMTYAGWNPSSATLIEPSLLFADDLSATAGVVTINLVTETEVVMSSLSESGQAFCIADAATGPGTTYGRIDASGVTSSAACSGGW